MIKMNMMKDRRNKGTRRSTGTCKSTCDQSTVATNKGLFSLNDNDELATLNSSISSCSINSSTCNNFFLSNDSESAKNSMLIVSSTDDDRNASNTTSTTGSIGSGNRSGNNGSFRMRSISSSSSNCRRSSDTRSSSSSKNSRFVPKDDNVLGSCSEHGPLYQRLPEVFHKMELDGTTTNTTTTTTTAPAPVVAATVSTPLSTSSSAKKSKEFGLFSFSGFRAKSSTSNDRGNNKSNHNNNTNVTRNSSTVSTTTTLRSCMKGSRAAASINSTVLAPVPIESENCVVLPVQGPYRKKHQQQRGLLLLQRLPKKVTSTLDNNVVDGNTINNNNNNNNNNKNNNISKKKDGTGGAVVQFYGKSTRAYDKYEFPQAIWWSKATLHVSFQEQIVLEGKSYGDQRSIRDYLQYHKRAKDELAQAIISTSNASSASSESSSNSHSSDNVDGMVMDLISEGTKIGLSKGLQNSYDGLERYIGTNQDVQEKHCREITRQVIQCYKETMVLLQQGNKDNSASNNDTTTSCTTCIGIEEIVREKYRILSSLDRSLALLTAAVSMHGSSTGSNVPARNTTTNTSTTATTTI